MQKTLENQGFFRSSCFRRPLLYPVELQAQVYRNVVTFPAVVTVTLC
jgi:hypothetical protein